MKKIALLAVAFLAGSTAFAQTSTTTSISGTKMGLKAGVSFPKYSFHVADGENPETETITNFHITGYADLPLSPNFSVQPGISLQGKGGKFSEMNVLGTTVENKQSTMWIEVPVNLVAKLPLGVTGTNLFVGAGPYAAYGIAGENKLENMNNGDEVSNDVKFGDSDNDDLKALDLGFNFIGGIQLNSGLNLSAGYGLGINDLRPNNGSNDGKQTNRVLSFSVGFAF